MKINRGQSIYENGLTWRAYGIFFQIINTQTSESKASNSLHLLASFINVTRHRLYCPQVSS